MDDQPYGSRDYEQGCYEYQRSHDYHAPCRGKSGILRCAPCPRDEGLAPRQRLREVRRAKCRYQ